MDAIRSKSRMKQHPHVAATLALLAFSMVNSTSSFGGSTIGPRHWQDAQQYGQVARSHLPERRFTHGRTRDWRDLQKGEKAYFLYGLIDDDGIARLDEALSTLKVKVIPRGCVTGTTAYERDMNHNARIERRLNVSIPDYLRRHAKWVGEK